MLNFILGFVVGVVVLSSVAIFQLYLSLHQQNPIEITFKEVKKKMSPKGSVLEPKTDEVVEFENMIQRNDKKGVETEIT